MARHLLAKRDTVAKTPPTPFSFLPHPSPRMDRSLNRAAQIVLYPRWEYGRVLLGTVCGISVPEIAMFATFCCDDSHLIRN
ncbi:hypothetical protein PRIPAC_72547 [Pristionchus pacificus]|uniref:Uncharacterized protein n=1 Tax=Pristionchus pacificus TaxID=54126 RepID=A0A2A6BGD5_PRIPA|nr:hypothetical protein PRIPAC_72547 [Pristionchus pacificus]|eukprot:PDM64985.1 hypothetical protein PRIPAC_53241 [Pristionchus pacificus]